MKKNKGFTLIELMIVVAIIAIIAAIAIPNLLRSRIQSNESAAIGNLRTVVGAQTSYHSANNTYSTDFDTLTAQTPPYLDGDWGVTKSGYDFTMGGSATNFSTNADPADVGTTGVRYFFVDASGVIRQDPAAAATAASDPIGQ
jgi:type IV pilus assembly protein PilA